MVAYVYRMGAGFSGDVNRTHPASIEPNVNDGTYPLTFYGQAALYTSTGTVRAPIAGDDTSTATLIAGVSVRPFPVQQQTASNYGEADIGFASVTNPNAMDILKSGYIMVPVAGAAVKGGQVFVWVAASTTGHVQGAFEIAANSTNTLPLPLGFCYFNGEPDASAPVIASETLTGVVEIAFNV